MCAFDRFRYLTFDCYGTLIDWENGLLGVIQPLLERNGVRAGEATILQHYARHEAELQSGSYQPYRSILKTALARVARDFGVTTTEEQQEQLPDSVRLWQPFPDTVAALAALRQRFKLVVISNIDNDLFAHTARLLQVEFDDVITAEQVRSYKPSRENFRAALRRLNASPDAVLHVAQSLYHDHVPARELGLQSVWVNRPSRVPGTGVTLPAAAQPSLTVSSLQELVAVIGL